METAVKQVERSSVKRIERTPPSLRDRKPVTIRPVQRLPFVAQRTRRRNDFSTSLRMTRPRHTHDIEGEQGGERGRCGVLAATLPNSTLHGGELREWRVPHTRLQGP
jgi:hypothetical protein